ncbi:MAG TPA: ATPase, T2SS/T4P/T4SS family [Pirellulales bacterium]|nr:ATPase, T2SS/T4P/T4SS family [Pirellulales bacterium]
MKIWFNKVDESRRTLVEATTDEVSIGRDATNQVVLSSPLVSRHHAVVRRVGEQLELRNVGLNSCVVGDREVAGGEVVTLSPGVKVRIWPFTLSFEAEAAAVIDRKELESHLRSIVAGLELRIHKKLLERLDLFEMERNRAGDPATIVLLENNIEDVCRELNVFGPENQPLLEEISGLVLMDLLINQLVMETGHDDFFDLASLTSNEFDVPATLVPERETELFSLLHFARERLMLAQEHDVSSRIRTVEERFVEAFHYLRPHLHEQLRKYVVLRTLKKDLKDTVFGFGPLQDLLRAPTITEIMVVDSDQIYVERDGVIERSGRRFISDKVTESIIERIVAQVGRRIDKSQPLVDARLPDGSRVNAIIPPLAVSGPCLTIRKFPVQRFTMDDLVENGSISRAAAAFLRACVIDHRSILVSGGTGTGKTTLLNVMSSFIPFKERVVTIEDTSELRLHQEHVVTLESKLPNAEGAGAYTIRDLVRNALRMRPDRIIVGECRGAEALDMIQAMNTGHAGSMTTVHANSSTEVIERLEVLMLMGAELPMISIHRQIASAIDLIVQITRFPNGKRRVTQVSELTGIHPETKEVIVIDIFNDRGAAGLQPTGYLPTFIDSLIEKRLLESKFLYGDMDGEDDSRRAIAGGAAQQTLSPPSTFNIPAPPPPHSRPIAHDTGREQATAGDQKRDRLAASHAPGDGQWYCLIAGNELGPLDARELRRMVRDGAIKPDDLVRCGPNGVWTPSRQANFP